MARGSWPQAPIIYQIYPRSFFDSNGDGVGDLPGIVQKLDYIASLGVDAIWLSPFYLSSWKDGGYDVIDHACVDPMMGREEDFDALVERAHTLGLRLVIDQVLNHTSDQHEWFKAALDGDDECAERYLFRDAKADGTPPNNWMSQFGLPGWEWSHRRDQYYFHQFLACQPSLNLRNPAVQEAHAEQIKGWRERGVDGFRFDAVSSYLWDESLSDNPPASPEVRREVAGHDNSPYAYQDHVYDMLPGDGAAYMEKLREWAGEDAYLFGEITSGNQSIEVGMEFSSPARLDACYTTDLPENRASPATVVDVIERTSDHQRLINWISSHDQPRHVDDGTAREAQAKVFAALMAFLPGPWLIYQGEEIGLPKPDLQYDDITDPLDRLFWPDHPGREGSRVPMPWSTQGPAYGFTNAKPWLRMRWNQSEASRENVVSFYRMLILERRRYGWDTAEIESARAEDTFLDLTIKAGPKRFHGQFAMGAENARIDGGGTMICEVKKQSGWGARIEVDK